MPIDWKLLIEKKLGLGHPAPLAAELNALEQVAADILQIRDSDRRQTWGISLGYGMRTKALIANLPGTDHRFREGRSTVILKLFRGPAIDFLRFHSDTFHCISAIQNGSFQRSIAAARTATQTWAVLEFIEGNALQSLWMSFRSSVAFLEQRSVMQLACPTKASRDSAHHGYLALPIGTALCFGLERFSGAHQPRRRVL